MKYKNPVVTGFYPDPSVCRANGKYYMVCSSFQFFPGVPLFESEDLLNWKQIGNVLTRESQLPLSSSATSGGIYAPTIRFEAGRFYMVVTNVSNIGNFYVYTDDIYGEWSDPIKVEQGGIDPSLYFEDARAYFCSNGDDPKTGISGIQLCEIDINTGKKLTESRFIWYGSGGRFVESPHIYKIGGKYILLTAEGGTEYGHMVTYAVADDIFGEYSGYDKNPVLTNRNLGGYPIQGVGHADLIEDNNGNYWLLHLGFRQQDRYKNYHHLGRETFLTPVTFGEDGYFTAGATHDMTGSGTVLAETETDRFPEGTVQTFRNIYTQENTDFGIDYLYIRNPVTENYTLTPEKITLRGTDKRLSEAASPTFIGLRQKEFDADICVNMHLIPTAPLGGAGGLTIYMDEDHHFDLHAEKIPTGLCVLALQNIGTIKYSLMKYVEVTSDSVELRITADRFNYSFYANGEYLGTAPSKYVSTEVAGGFTGVIIGLYAENAVAEFDGFKIEYENSNN
jgi:alpha-N-arabinofuranosidase